MVSAVWAADGNVGAIAKLLNRGIDTKEYQTNLDAMITLLTPDSI
jgi:hypothetical protein